MVRPTCASRAANILRRGSMMKARYVFTLVGAVLLAAALAGCSSGPTVTSIHVIEHATTDTVTDVGDAGDSVGDLLTFANEVYDENNETQVGMDSGFCIRTVAGESWECFWTLYLDDGQITVHGPFYDSGVSVLAITGGTGIYGNAQGEMRLEFHNEEGTEFDFYYEIIQ